MNRLYIWLNIMASFILLSGCSPFHHVNIESIQQIPRFPIAVGSTAMIKVKWNTSYLAFTRDHGALESQTLVATHVDSSSNITINLYEHEFTCQDEPFLTCFIRGKARGEKEFEIGPFLVEGIYTINIKVRSKLNDAGIPNVTDKESEQNLRIAVKSAPDLGLVKILGPFNIIVGENSSLAPFIDPSIQQTFIEPYQYEWRVDNQIIPVSGPNNGLSLVDLSQGSRSIQLAVVDSSIPPQIKTVHHNLNVLSYPKAEISRIPNPNSPDSVLLSATPSSPENEIARYDWSITPCDKAVFNCSFSSAISPEWPITNLPFGNYEVSLTITTTDNPPYSGQVASTVDTLEFTPVGPPLAAFTFHDQAADTPPLNILSVDGSASENTTEWQWEILYTPTGSLDLPTTLAVSGPQTTPFDDFPDLPASGRFEIYLTAKNASGQSDTKVLGFVRNVDPALVPTAAFIFTDELQNTPSVNRITVDGSGSSADTVEWRWTLSYFDPLVGGQTAVIAESGPQSVPDYVFDDPSLPLQGLFTIDLLVKNEAGFIYQTSLADGTSIQFTR